MPRQNSLTVAGRAHRRVHLDQIAEPGIVVGRQGEVVRRRLAARDILVVLEEIDLFGRGDVQDMDARAGGAGNAHQAFRALQGGDLVAPDGMR